MFQPPQERPLPINAFPRRMQPREIIDRVLVWHPGVTRDDIMGDRRFRHIVAARWDIIVALRTLIVIEGKPLSYPWIGRQVGGMDHTSVMHALRKRGET